MLQNEIPHKNNKKHFENNKTPKKHFFKQKKVKSKKNIKEEFKDHICRICGSNVFVSTHHIRYKSEGGDDSTGNLIALCFKCHRKVHDGIYHSRQFISGRDFILYHLERINPHKYEEVLKYLRSKKK